MSYFRSVQNLFSFSMSMKYPAAKCGFNPCWAREGEKSLGSFSHFPAAAPTPTRYRCAPRGRCSQVTGTASQTHWSPQTHPTLKDKRSMVQFWLPTLHIPHQQRRDRLLFLQVSTGQEFSLVILHHSCGLLKAPSGAAQTWIYTVFINELRKRSA